MTTRDNVRFSFLAEKLENEQICHEFDASMRTCSLAGYRWDGVRNDV